MRIANSLHKLLPHFWYKIALTVNMAENKMYFTQYSNRSCVNRTVNHKLFKG